MEIFAHQLLFMQNLCQNLNVTNCQLDFWRFWAEKKEGVEEKEQVDAGGGF